MDVFLTILDVLLQVSGCIFGSNSLYECIISRGYYTITNIHPGVFLPAVKMPCTQPQKTLEVTLKNMFNLREEGF